MNHLRRFEIEYAPNAVQAIAVGMLQQAFLDLRREGERNDVYKWGAYDFLTSGEWCEIICDAAQVEYSIVQARFKEVLQEGNADFLSRPSKSGCDYKRSAMELRGFLSKWLSKAAPLP
jgi:hypothetical protein